MPYAPGLANEYIPSLGPDKQFVVGSTNLGVSTVDTTLVSDTARTHAQLIASPPNTDAGAFAFGPVVHSLGVPPAFALLLPRNSSGGAGIVPIYVTADNSAVYFEARSHTASARSFAARMIAFR